MNYYRRYVGNYLKKTARLSLLEHGAYSLMLDYYYAEEKPLPAERREVYRLVRALDRDEQHAIDGVLEQFFVLHDDGYHNERADEELGIAAKVIETARENGKLGGRPKTKNITQDETENRTCNETSDETGTVTRDEPANNHPSTTNHLTASPQPSTATQQPSSKAKARAKKPAPPVFFPPWAQDDEPVKAAWHAYAHMRADKRKPMTELAVERIWKKLSGWRVDGHDVSAILMKSHDCGWTDVYPLNEGVPRATSVAEANARAAQEFIEQGERTVGPA